MSADAGIDLKCVVLRSSLMFLALVALGVGLRAAPPDQKPFDDSRKTLTLGANGNELTYTYDTKGEHTRITAVLDDLQRAGIRFKDLRTTQSSLEDIFVGLVRERR